MSALRFNEAAADLAESAVRLGTYSLFLASVFESLHLKRGDYFRLLERKIAHASAISFLENQHLPEDQRKKKSTEVTVSVLRSEGIHYDPFSDPSSPDISWIS